MLHFGHHPAGPLPTRCLIEKALVLDQRLEAGPSHRTRQQLGDIPFQVLVGRNADGVAYTPLFERLVEHDILQFLTRQVVLNVIRRGLAHVQDRLSFDMGRLDLVTHRAPPLRFPPSPALPDAASVTAPAIARAFVEHRTTDSSNAGCIADEQTTGVGSISAGPSILPSAPPACSKYRGFVLGTSGARTRGRAACKTSLRSRRDGALANHD